MSKMTPYARHMSTHICALVDVLVDHVPDAKMLQQLRTIATDQQQWPKAHAEFTVVRRQLLERQQDSVFYAQCTFTELCLKALYNETDTDAPFDSDSPFWVVPSALLLAESVGLDTAVVVSAIL